MAKKSVAPSPTESAFDCPHCGAYTTQTWWDVFAKKDKAPGVFNADMIDKVKADKKLDEPTRKKYIEVAEKLLSGLIFMETSDSAHYNIYNLVLNLHLTQCFNCGEIAVWVNRRLSFPTASHAPDPNADLPTGVLADYNEAGRVLTLSPRSSAALLRLSIQKLCVELGEKGKSIDDDIASLVKKGLSPVIQQALDTVRVTGNEAVHPGTMDLKDDVDTATKLFNLVNIISEQMISNPKHVKALYEKLPAAKREAIDKRDGKGKTDPEIGSA